jgi:hypothetical protein
MDALAGPGVITHDEYEDPDSENGVDEPAKSRCRYVEHDSDRRPQLSALKRIDPVLLI